jgi:hypothetical protein
MELPRSLPFIEGSIFVRTNCECLSIEAGHNRFAFNPDFLIDVIDHRLIRNFSSSSNIIICSDIEILGSSCFESCQSLSSSSFESTSRLNRIESSAFFNSSLQSISIPRNVQFIDGSAFCGTRCDHVSIEAGHNRFEIRNSFLIDFVDHRLIRNFSSSSNIEIFSNIEILGSSCFSYCYSLSSISFESKSQWVRIESKAFERLCFSVIVPSSSLFIAKEAARASVELLIADIDCSPDYLR